MEDAPDKHWALTGEDPTTVRLPLSTNVAPVKVLSPLRVNVPDPIFVKPPEPDKIPEKVEVVLSAPTVNCDELRLTSPLPEIDPIVSFLLTT